MQYMYSNTYSIVMYQITYLEYLLSYVFLSCLHALSQCDDDFILSDGVFTMVHLQFRYSRIHYKVTNKPVIVC